MVPLSARYTSLSFYVNPIKSYGNYGVVFEILNYFSLTKNHLNLARSKLNSGK